MGRDKAALAAPPYASLLARQLAVLAATGTCEMLVSARRGQSLPCMQYHVTVVRDDGSAGPLGGLVAVLRATRTPRVLVLGVDVARIDAAMLRRIVGTAAEATPDIGVIPRTVSAPQPLAALWPLSALPLAESQLAAASDLSLRTLITHGIAAGILRWLDIPSWDEPRFANWNRPLDVHARP